MLVLVELERALGQGEVWKQSHEQPLQNYGGVHQPYLRDAEDYHHQHESHTLTCYNVEHGDPNVRSGRHREGERKEVHIGEHSPSVEHKQQDHVEPVQVLGERVYGEDEEDDYDYQARHHVVDQVPDQRGQPEVHRVHAAHKLDVLGLDGALPHQEQHKAASQERHAEGQVEAHGEAGRVFAKTLVVDL
ncbi:hypothetical protein EGW08_003154, partial [Elysia chlorotica]